MTSRTLEQNPPSIKDTPNEIGDNFTINQMRLLGDLYKTGTYALKESKRGAIFWYSEAAKRGHAESQFALFDTYLEYKNYEETPKETYTNAPNANAYYWCGQAAGNGHAEAQSHFGVMNYMGLGSPRDYTKALHWILEAGKNGQVTEAGKQALSVIYATNSLGSFNRNKAAYCSNKLGNTDFSVDKLASIM